jgi:hypothetical protein
MKMEACDFTTTQTLGIASHSFIMDVMGTQIDLSRQASARKNVLM